MKIPLLVRPTIVLITAKSILIQMSSLDDIQKANMAKDSADLQTGHHTTMYRQHAFTVQSVEIVRPSDRYLLLLQ